jgi:hypothetical protein
MIADKPREGITTSTRVGLRWPRGGSPALDFGFFRILGAGLCAASSLVVLELADCA